MLCNWRPVVAWVQNWVLWSRKSTAPEPIAVSLNGFQPIWGE